MEGTASITSRQHERELITRAEEAIGAARDELRGSIEDGRLNMPRPVDVELEDGVWTFGHFGGFFNTDDHKLFRFGDSRPEVSPDGTITHEELSGETQAAIADALARGDHVRLDTAKELDDLPQREDGREYVCLVLRGTDGTEGRVPYRIEHAAYRTPDGRALTLDNLAAALAEQDARGSGDVELADAVSRAGSAPAEDVYPLPEAMQDYLHGSYATKRNSSTRATHRSALRSWTRWLCIDRALAPEDATAEDETDWLQWLHDEDKARSTLRTYDGAIRGFYEWCAENGVHGLDVHDLDRVTERRSSLLGAPETQRTGDGELHEAKQDRLPVKKHVRPKSKVDKKIFGEPCADLEPIMPGRTASIDMAGEDEQRDVRTLVKLTYDAGGIFYFTPEGMRVGGDHLGMDDRSSSDAVASLWCAGIRHFSARQVLETRGVANPSKEQENEELRHLEWLSHWVVNINWRGELRDGGTKEAGGIRPLLDIWPEYYTYTAPNGGTTSVYGFEMLSEPVLLSHAAATGQLAIWDQEPYTAVLEDARGSALMRDLEEYVAERITSMGRTGANNNTIRVDTARRKMLPRHPNAQTRTVAKDMRIIAAGCVSSGFSFNRKVGKDVKEFRVVGIDENPTKTGRGLESITFHIRQMPAQKPKTRLESPESNICSTCDNAHLDLR